MALALLPPCTSNEQEEGLKQENIVLMYQWELIYILETDQKPCEACFLVDVIGGIGGASHCT